MHLLDYQRDVDALDIKGVVERLHSLGAVHETTIYELGALLHRAIFLVTDMNNNLVLGWLKENENWHYKALREAMNKKRKRVDLYKKCVHELEAALGRLHIEYAI